MSQNTSATHESNVLTANSLHYEVIMAEREIKGYDQTIKENRRIKQRMKDKTDRLKYKVARQLADVDTTKEHKMSYLEWQLLKAEKARAEATEKLAKAEQQRQQKVVYLSGKQQEWRRARDAAALSVRTSEPTIPGAPRSGTRKAQKQRILR